MSDPFEDGVVVSIGRDRYRTECRSGEHVIVADEPADYGGTDAGVSPYQLLLSAVGACKAMTLRMYADRKGWPLEGVVVALKHDHRHPEDCKDCDSPDAKLPHIDVELQVFGPELTAEQRQRLAEIADRCPVHRTITSDVRLESKLVEAE